MTTVDDPWITVYRLHGCPYCERVIRVLDALNLPYRSRFVEAMHSRRSVVKRTAGVRTVPVLVDDRTGTSMGESANIVTYLESTYGKDGPLHPDAVHVSVGGSGDGDGSEGSRDSEADRDSAGSRDSEADRDSEGGQDSETEDGTMVDGGSDSERRTEPDGPVVSEGDR